MGRGYDLDIVCPVANRFNIRFDEWIGSRRAGVDEDESSACVDQIAAEIVGADVIDISDDFESWEGLFPFLVGDRHVHALLGDRSIDREAREGKSHRNQALGFHVITS